MRLFYLLSISLFSLFEVMNGQLSFHENSIEAGLRHVHRHVQFMGGGIAAFDYDNDGDEDLYVTGGNNPDALFENNGEGLFENISIEVGLHLIVTQIATTSVVTGDINNDGIREIFIGTEKSFGSQDYTHNLLLQMNPLTGQYEEVSALLGIRDSSFCMGAHFMDIDRNGYLDIYINNYVETPGFIFDNEGVVIGFDHTCGKNKLYLNFGGDFFADRTDIYGLGNNGCTLASTSLDIDEDRDMDLIVANDFGEWIQPNALYYNRYPTPTFNEVSGSLNVDDEIYAMGIASGDYDQDGDMDFYITNIGMNLFYNNDNGHFRNVALESGVIDESVEEHLSSGWGTFFADINNDSWLDLFVGNGFVNSVVDVDNDIQYDRLFMGSEDLIFTEVGTQVGVNYEGLTRGAIYCDVNQDGKLDILSVTTDAFLPGTNNFIQYYENQSSHSNNWIGFKLIGTVSNRDAFGSRIELFAGRKKYINELVGGSSHISQNSSIVHFGIGHINEVDSVVVYWPNGTREMFKNLSINHVESLIEGGSLTTNTSDLYEGSEISIFPNPATDQIQFSQNLIPFKRYEILNTQGIMILTGIIDSDKVIDVSSLNEGCYVLYLRGHEYSIARMIVKG